MTVKTQTLAWLMLLLLAPFTPLSAAEEAPIPTRVVLDNVDRYRVPEPLFEGVRVILAYRGETYSPAYIQGLCGAAFRLGGPCPCAPTCEYAMSTDRLIQLLGYESRRLAVAPSGPEREQQWTAMLAAVKEEIRAGRPVLVWHAFTSCEFDVVCGFDEEKRELYGRGSYAGLDAYAVAKEDRALESTAWCGDPHALLIGEKTRAFDTRTAEIAALKEAVAHARGLSGELTSLPTGLATYDYWIAAYQNRGLLIRAKSRDGEQDLGFVAAQPPDDFYPLTIWPSTRQAAADFLREIAPKCPDAQAHLEAAALHFAHESEALAACREALADRSNAPTDEQCVRAAGHLSEARAMYQLGVDEIARAVRKIDPVKWDVP